MASCICPYCRMVERADRSTYGHIQCSGCGGKYWIPADAFMSAPYARHHSDGYPIIGVYFNGLTGYRVISKNHDGQYVVGRSYDPFRGFWLGGDYFPTLSKAETSLSGYKKVGGS